MLSKNPHKDARRWRVISVLSFVCVALLATALTHYVIQRGNDETPAVEQERPAVGQLITENKTLTKLADLVEKAGLTDVLNGQGAITFFAPSDAAINLWNSNSAQYVDLVKPENRNQLRALLLGHVVEGRISLAQALETGSAQTRAGNYLYLHRDKDGNPMTSDAHIIKADIEAGNGIIHILDEVLVSRPDLIDTARKDEQLTTFLKAVEIAGLTSTLRESGPLTILAPNNEAFEALDKETLADLLKPANKAKLTNILKYHIIPGWKHTFDKQQMDYLPTLQGEKIKIMSPSAAEWKIELGQARLERLNIDASNGVLHVVDRVLIPPP
jgi:transforming growth factor-beta-induced protein